MRLLNLELNRLYGGNGLYKKLIKRDRVMVIGGTIGILLVIILLVWVLPSFKMIRPYEGKIGLVVGGNIINTIKPPIVANNSVLVSFNDIKDYIDENIFYDSTSQKVIITTETKVIRLKTDKNIGVSNNKVLALNGKVKIIKGAVYIPIDEFKDIYNIDVKYIKSNNVVVIDELGEKTTIGTSKKDGLVIRKLPSIKEPIVEKTKNGEKVRVFGEVAKKWYKVRTPDGTIGFIQKKYLNSTIQTTEPALKTAYHKWKPALGKINLVWEQIEKVTPAMDNVDKADGLDVVVPTWFEITDANGTIKNKADSAYVRWAKANGYKVWGLVSNGFKTDITSKFLENSDTREKIENELVNLAGRYDLDGINLDFEYVSMKDKDLLTQFVRELAPLLREKGLTISMDVTVKVASVNSMFYDRKALGQAADYIILMSYDEFWSTSPIAGPVAEYSWVDKNILSTLKEVPKEKLIMGIPFYSRQWKETNGKLGSNSLSMASVQNVIRQNGANVKWDEKSGQNYTEFNKGDSKIKIWVEDTKSLNMKSSLALKYDLAGVAAWRRGYESPSIWSILKRNLKDYNNFDEWKKNFRLN